MKRLMLLLIMPALAFGASIGGPPSQDIDIDSATDATVITDYEHHKNHEEKHFSYEDFFTLDNGETNTFSIQTSDTTEWTHITWAISAQGETEFYMYMDAAVTFDGTDLTAFNDNGNSANTNNWVQFQENATIVSNGTLIISASVGDATNPVNGIPGTSKRGQEKILKQSAVYNFIFISRVNGNTITVAPAWYLHANKN